MNARMEAIRASAIKVRRRWPMLVREAGPVFLVFLANIVLTGWAYSLVEGVGPIAGPWWGVVTGSTTGYGDLYPTTTVGRGLACYLILSSLLLNDIRAARVVKVMVDDPDRYSHLEQEEARAMAVLSLALDARQAGLHVEGLPSVDEARKGYEVARAAVLREREEAAA